MLSPRRPGASRPRHTRTMLLGGLLLLVSLWSLTLGAVHVPFSDIMAIVLHPTSAQVDPTQIAIIRDLRGGRLVLGILIGAGLAMAGTALQGLFHNPLADPFVVGASSGAALGAALAITAGWRVTGGGFGAVPFAAFVGALLAVAVVYSIAEVGGVTSVTSLLLAGAALSTVLGAVVSLLMLSSTQNAYTVFTWLLGSLAGRSWGHVQGSLPYLLLGMGTLWVLARPLDALAFGDETARSLGLSLRWARGILVAAASLTTAAAVAAGGTIGFVGLIAPHTARLLVGAAHDRVLPTSALLGALLLVVADDIARTAWAPLEMPVGMITALLGGPFFLYLLKTRQWHLGG